jgi:signal peptidase I
MIYKMPIYNVNWVTKKAGLDQCGNETTWGFGGYGKPGSGFVSRILGKPGITKGGQTVIISDVNHLRQRAYIHHHHHKKHKKPRGWNKQGPFEIKCILKDVKNMVHVDGNHDDSDNDSEDNQMYLWDKLPHFT